MSGRSREPGDRASSLRRGRGGGYLVVVTAEVDPADVDFLSHRRECRPDEGIDRSEIDRVVA